MRYCWNCTRRLFLNTKSFPLYYCMAFNKYVFPTDVCAWHMPMSGYKEEEKNEEDAKKS